MGKRVLHRRLLAVMGIAVIFTILSIPAAFCQINKAGEAEYHNQQGMTYFKKGFYDHAPKNQVADTERNYGLAIREFKAALESDPFHIDAHRNLARVYYVKKDFNSAAGEYRRVTELLPGDIDAYVILALSLTKLRRFDEAIEALESGKQHTSDPEVLNKLDTYIAKIVAHQAGEVK
jgi:tetratricopeptide (TPR) repeat protein